MTLGPSRRAPVDVVDVSRLPTYAFGHRSLLWWGTMGFVVIEGTLFALLISSYLYLRARSQTWPLGAYPPLLLWGTCNLALLLLSAVPNQLAKNAAERLDLRATRRWLVVCLIFGLGFIWVRWQEFQALNVWWDTNAYGSIVWTLLAFHTFHLLTDEADSAVLTALLFIGPLEESRFVDVSESAMYWYFVVAAWLPIYVVLYLAPRLW
jgi:cytochrome c oxidase subunit III